MDWLMLRGLSREIGHFGDFPGRFQAAVPGARAVPLDLAGFGDERRSLSPLSVHGMVEDLRRRWRPSGPAGILGISLGGMVALDWAARYPDDFAHVVLVGSSCAGLSPPWHRFAPSTFARLPLLFATREPRRRERLILDLVSNAPTELKERTADAWGALQKQRPPRRSAALRQIAAAARFPAPKTLRAELLVLASRADGLVRWECSQRLAAHFGAPLGLHDTGGHDLVLDAPDWVCDSISAWLRAPERRQA